MIGYVRIVLFKAEDGIRDLVRSRGLGDVYKRQGFQLSYPPPLSEQGAARAGRAKARKRPERRDLSSCLLYTSDAADERSSVDLGGRRIIKKKK